MVPPYWKKTWFYALEVAFFSILVILSIQLSAMNERYQIVSRLFSLLTVIMLIQLIQTAVYTTMASYSLIDVRSSPVVDFFIQVSIALLVLPLEGGLRKLISNTASGKFSLSKLMGIRKLMRRGSWLFECTYYSSPGRKPTHFYYPEGELLRDKKRLIR